MINGVKFAKNVAEILLSEVSDIDLILLYGAFAQGRGHPRSDYDMIAISDTKTIDWKFVLDGVPVNLWSMTWEEAKDLILGKDGRFWSIGASSLAKSIVIYSKDADMLSKLNNLVLRVTEGGKSALKQAIERFDYTYGLLWRLKQSIELSNLLEVRILKWDLFNELNCALSAVNKKYFLNNWGKQFQELSTFDLLPENYISRVKNFIVSKPEENIEVVSKRLEQFSINSTPVVDDEGRLVGIITLGDINKVYRRLVK